MSQQEIYQLLKKSKKKLSADKIQEKIGDVTKQNVLKNLKRLARFGVIEEETINKYGKKLFYVEGKK